MVVYGYYYALGLVVGGLALTFITSWVWALPFYILAAFWPLLLSGSRAENPAGTGGRLPGRRESRRRETERGLTRLSIFLNIFDVHVNRTLLAGHRQSGIPPGKFMVASKESQLHQNEQNSRHGPGRRHRPWSSNRSPG